MESPEIGSGSDSSNEYDDMHDDQIWAQPYGGSVSRESYSRTGGGAKRRFAPGLHVSRDAKSRRRDDPGPSRKQSAGYWDAAPAYTHVQTGKKDDLIDSTLVETLRQSRFSSVAS